MADQPLLEVQDLAVEFRTRTGVLRAVDGLSLSLRRGQALAVLGESGSGKSMTALAVMGLVPRPAGRVVGGRVLLDGRDLLRVGEQELRSVRGERVAMIFQDPLSSLNPVFTVGNQIGEMFRRHRGASRRQARAAAIALMDRVQIPNAAGRVNDYPHQFSGGMRQRVMIAMALALDPEVLVADEPTTALDVTVQAQIMELLRTLQRESHMGLILISHDLGVVADAAHDVLVMYAGRVVESGPLEAVYRHSSHPYTRGLMASLPRLRERKGRLVPITGAPPSMLRVPPGCAFHPRCPYTESRCRSDVPALRALSEDQRSACHFAEDIRRETKDRTRGSAA